jgi:hypothetical protein
MRHSSTTSIAALAFVLIGTQAMATDYYVSPSGNDSNNGTSQSSAWRTIARVQQLQYVLQPGDRILFERGASFSGQLDINSSGTAGQPIVIGAYGSGNLPVISGSTTTGSWTQHQGNIWRASVAQPVKYVRVNGEMMTLARYPNTGWLRVNTSSNTQLNSTSLNQANGYWNGARLVVRSTNWCYENAEISGFSNGTLSFPAITYNPGNYDWGFFVCNKLSELDAPGEWFHDTNAGVLYLWAPGNADPNTVNVQASVHENGINVGWQKSHVRIEDLLFRGQRYAGVNNGGASYVTITGCTFEWSNHAIRSYGNHDNYSNNIVRNIFASGMALIDNNTTIENNTITDIALIPGLGESFWGYYGMYALGDDNVIRNNSITNTGNSGMFLEGSPLVEKNIIRGPLATVNDGGGIYWDNSDGMIIQDNIIEDLDGNMESVAMDYHVNYKIGHGIYFGNAVINNTIVRRNTVSGCHGAGIHVDHTMVSNGIQVRDNVLYDNDIQLSLSDYSNYNGPGAAAPYHVPSYNSVYSGNTLYCMNKDQLCVQQYHVYSNNLVDFGTFTNNRHFNPFNELTTFIIKLYSGTVKHYSLERWQAERGEETGSTRSPHRQNSNEVTGLLSPNLVSNSNFDYNTNGWSGWPTQGQILRDNTMLDNGAAKIVYGQNSGSPEFYLRTDATTNVQNGQWYEMRFSMQSNMHGVVRAEFKGQSQASGPNAIFSKSIPFDSQRRDISLVFQSTLSEPGLFIFANNFNESTYWLDNVELYRVTVAPVDPYTRHILLTNGTNTAVDVPLSGCWRDVQGALHNTSIPLPAWGSVVLAKEDDDLCGLTTGQDEEEEGVAASTGPVPFPNPVGSGAPLFLTQAVKSVTEMEILDTAGRSVQRAQMAAGTMELPIGERLPSGHYFILLRSNGSVDRHRVVVQ